MWVVFTFISLCFFLFIFVTVAKFQKGFRSLKEVLWRIFFIHSGLKVADLLDFWETWEHLKPRGASAMFGSKVDSETKQS